MKPPVLCLQTTYFHESDRAEAQRLGHDLYARLTRPIGDPLAFGPGIPVLVGVAAEQVQLQAAEMTVVIPVLGKSCYNETKDRVLATLVEWHQILGAGHVLVVPLSENWRSVESRMPSKQMLSMLYGKGDPRSRTFDEIVLATARLWEPARANVRLFVSHAKADLTATEGAAEKIYDYVVTDSTGRAFFDANSLQPGESLDRQLDTAVSRGVLIAVRGDAYSSRVWCQRELLLAKQHGMPTLTVEVLRRGELRSSPYGGNSPSLVWDKNPAPIVSQAMIEWLRTEFFRREAQRVIAAAELPADVAIVARPPELLDLAQGPLHSDRAQLVLHPDPELSVIERRILKSARPRLHLATPSTAFRRLLGRRNEAAEGSSPLEGMQIAMSLSETPDAGGADGFTEHHVVDATVQIARALISAGAAIAYGGDFRAGGYTPLLAQLIQTYNQTATKPAQDLHSYLAAIVDLGAAPENVPLSVHHLKKPAEFAREARLPDPSARKTPIPPALYFSDLRRVMEKFAAARIILGGQARPRTELRGKGYGGRYPGLVEEAWRALEAGNPLYVVGGFGGAAALVADLLEGKKIPKLLQDRTWAAEKFFTQNSRTLDAHPQRTKLGLPKRMEDLAKALMKLAAPRLKNDAAAVAWNGLTVEENHFLFRTRDPVALATLISRGLLRVARRRNEGKLQVELVHDSLVAADKLDAVAIATLDGVPLGGAGAAIDQLSGHAATDARTRGRTLASLQESLIDADWLLLSSLGAVGEPKALLRGIERAARETIEQAARHGFQRVGVVTFGGNVLPDTPKVAAAMIRGFSKTDAPPAVVWYETDECRFTALRTTLEKMPGVQLTTRRALTRTAFDPAPPEPFILTVSLENRQLSTTSLPPSSAAAVFTHRTELSPAALAQLAEGESGQRVTPRPATLEKRGRELAKRLFGPQAAEILSLCRASRLVVVHDTAASRIPFEMLLAAPDLRPALGGGMTRRLSVSGLAFERQFSQPPKRGKLKVLLVANPTSDLDGAADEAKAVREILRLQGDRLDVDELWETDATPQNVAAALRQADILHYCGHAFFDGPGAAESGLLLAGHTPFTGEQLGGIDPLPRMAFVNACEAGRVRGRPATNATAFAELFLHSGIDAYLGTFWEVGDTAAALFASTVYTQLAMGTTLEQATLAGRNALFTAHEPDWANYLLFGGGNFRLVARG